MRIYQLLILITVSVVLLALQPVPIPLPSQPEELVADGSMAVGDLFMAGEAYRAAIPFYDLAHLISGNPEALIRKGDAARALNDRASAMESYHAAVGGGRCGSRQPRRLYPDGLDPP